MVTYEVVIYRKDGKCVSSYIVEPRELQREIETLNENVKNGVIADFDIATV